MDSLYIRVKPAERTRPSIHDRQRHKAVDLPLDAIFTGSDPASIAGAIADLGYPQFRHLRGAEMKNPAAVLLAAVSADDSEARILEALPWVVVEYYNLDWDWLITRAKQRNIQNRLGFIVTLACRIAETSGQHAPLEKLRQIETTLKRARVASEDTLCQASLTKTEREWLRNARSEAAQFWHLLTDLDFEPSLYEARLAT